MDDHQLERRIAFSKDYDMLQGLTGACTGLGVVLGSLSGSALPFYLGLISSAATSAWYQKRYGRQRTRTTRSLVGVVIGIVGIVAVCVAAGEDQWQRGPVLWGPLASAILLTVAYWLGLKHAGMTVWHWVVMAALAGSSLLSLAGWHPGRLATLLPLGVALMVLGMIDHVRLVRVFGAGAAA